METNINMTFHNIKMSDAIFNKLSNFIYQELGIKMPEVKRVMLESRLHRRLKELNVNTFEEYCNIVFNKKGSNSEIVHMIDVVTTNKTDFFREPAHFDYLKSVILPQFTRRPLKIWSSACSSGEEPYTLAMVLQEAVENNQLYDYNILASDISTRMLKTGLDAIYPLQRLEGIPLNIIKKNFLKSKDPLNKTARIIPELRNKVTFIRLNLMEDLSEVKDMFDVIFCRNVLIYFDRQTQEKVINKLCGKLKNDGYFFLGHSESITGMNVSLVNQQPTIFKKA